MLPTKDKNSHSENERGNRKGENMGKYRQPPGRTILEPYKKVTTEGRSCFRKRPSLGFMDIKMSINTQNHCRERYHASR